jgi:hypothetical protein
MHVSAMDSTDILGATDSVEVGEIVSRLHQRGCVVEFSAPIRSRAVAAVAAARPNVAAGARPNVAVAARSVTARSNNAVVDLLDSDDDDYGVAIMGGS